MPRRNVQEVTVEDVQKRRNPNKHYVSLSRCFKTTFLSVSLTIKSVERCFSRVCPNKETGDVIVSDEDHVTAPKSFSIRSVFIDVCVSVL